MLFHDFPQQAHTITLFFRGHVSSIVQCLCHFGKIIGIDQNRSTTQLLSSARELTYDQNPAFVDLGRAELLRNQIHPVLQRSDQANISGAIVGEKLLAAKITMDVMNRNPSRLCELAIDLAHQQFYFAPEMLVIRDLFPAGNNHLHKRDVAAQFRTATQQEPERFEPLGNPLGVIQTIHAEHQQVSGKTSSDLSRIRSNFRLCRLFGKLFKINTDGKRAHYSLPSIQTNEEMGGTPFGHHLGEEAFQTA